MTIKLFKLTLFNFLVGNEDMHLKNYSLITRGKITTLAPAYDLVNSSIAIVKPAEEMALFLGDKKRNFNKKIFLDYFAKTRLDLNQKSIDEIVRDIQDKLPLWRQMIGDSFLSAKMKKAYLDLLDERARRLEW